MNRRFSTIHRNYTQKFSHQSKRRDTRLRIAGMSQVSINKTRQLLWIFISRSVALCSAVNDVYSISGNCTKMANIQTKFSIGENELLNSSIQRFMKSEISCWLASVKTQCLIFLFKKKRDAVTLMGDVMMMRTCKIVAQFELVTYLCFLYFKLLR